MYVKVKSAKYYFGRIKFKMDVFVEYMVKRKKNITDFLKVIGVLIGGFVLMLVLGSVFGALPALGSISLFILAGIVYLMYYLVTSINLEYEYILTGTELDVDKIINVRKRKKMTTVNIRGIECFSKLKNAEYNSYKNDSGINKIYACIDKNDLETYFVVFFEKEKKTMLLFNPNEKIADRIKTLNPQKTFID